MVRRGAWPSSKMGFLSFVPLSSLFLPFSSFYLFLTFFVLLHLFSLSIPYFLSSPPWSHVPVLGACKPV